MADCLPSLVKEIGKCIWDCFLKSHFDYWWCFDGNIEGLGKGIDELKRKIEDIKSVWRLTPIRPAKVEIWLSDSTKKLEEALKILPDGNIPGNIPNWDIRFRYSLGKDAKETAKEITKLLNQGDHIQKEHSAPSAAMASPPHRSMDFGSRKVIEEDIIKSLKESSVDMIGICGMGGVGKTTMAQSIWKRVIEENLFEEGVMVTVSHKIEMLKIQEGIAEQLNLKFDDKYLSTRAVTLRKRLMDPRKKLVILDDVWGRLKLDDLGVPLKCERVKILLTTRSEDVCNEMEAQKIIAMKILTEEEAWILFKNKSGDCVEDSNLKSIAKAVVAECKGLPLALETIGLALRANRNERKWKDSLSQLSKSNPTCFPEVLRDVYKPLKLSYDYLDNDRERDLFLLCCLFPEDFGIGEEELTWYSMGLGLVDDIHNIEEARNRTHNLVEKLKSRFLLINVGKYVKGLEVKMHDVVRDVAIYIGSTEKDGFLKSLHRRSTENSSDVNCNWMSVDISNEQMEVPLLSRFPKLQLLMWSSKPFYDISHLSFEGMEDLKVLSFEHISIGSLPPTLGSLKNLHTLRLVKCEVENISVIGKLTSLKIFSCDRCDNIAELPAEIGRLKGLRLLDLNNCRKLQRIPLGVISNLVWLLQLEVLDIIQCVSMEELFWNEGTDENTNGCIALPKLEQLRLMFLINLISLSFFKDVSFGNLKSINIFRCDKLRSLFLVSAARTCLLQLEVLKIQRCYKLEHVFWNEGTDDNTDGCIEFSKLEQLTLLDLPNLTAFCQGFENSVIKLPNLTKLTIGILPKLISMCPLNSETLVCHDYTTSLHFVCNPKVELGCLKELSLRRDNSRNIWCHQISNNVFNNLETLAISSVKEIRSLMSTSIAKSFVSLKYLLIGFCHELVEVIERDEDDDKQVVDINCLFPSLTRLAMLNLPKLKKFWHWNHALELPLLEKVDFSNCPVMETFTLGSINTPNIKVITVNNKEVSDSKNLNDVIRHVWIRVKKSLWPTETKTKTGKETETRTRTKIKAKMSTTMRM